MRKSDQLGEAIAIVAAAFKHKLDRGGIPYIMHCLYVMNAMPADDPELMVIAVMHDLIEDTNWTIPELVMFGYSKRITDALTLLTHVEGVPYEDYIRAIATNPDAKIVKRADLRHNSDITRIKGLREKDFVRLQKYHTAFAYLSD